MRPPTRIPSYRTSAWGNAPSSAGSHWKRRARDDDAASRSSLETLGDFDNAMYLCPADHAAFDARDPGLIVVPTYFDFFIDHERRWQEQEQMRKTSPPKVRMPVLPSQYAAYCAKILGKEETTGLYTAYMVVDYSTRRRAELAHRARLSGMAVQARSFGKRSVWQLSSWDRSNQSQCICHSCWG